jgi:hypothetical protein
VFGIPRHEFGRGLVAGPPGILELIPLGRADLGKKALHRSVVVEQLPIQVAGIPVEHHATEIENGDLDRRSARSLTAAGMVNVMAIHGILAPERRSRAENIVELIDDSIGGRGHMLESVGSFSSNHSKRKLDQRGSTVKSKTARQSCTGRRSMREGD